ncbi:hypothetical protein J6590_010960 [Homalodisca vitripennis]|nr:hypothetical protein J6590_010960 [Homalodisca vitripennis]
MERIRTSLFAPRSEDFPQFADMIEKAKLGKPMAQTELLQSFLELLDETSCKDKTNGFSRSSYQILKTTCWA